MNNRQTTFAIPLGKKILETTFPASTTALSVREPEQIMDNRLFCSRLNSFLQKNPLDLAQPIIVVTDKTRLCGYPRYLPLLIKTLTAHGMQQDDLRFIIAYGTHPPQSDRESRELYGSPFDDFPFSHHDCRDRDLFIDLGTTSRGTPIRFRRDLMEASAVITMGPVVHHYFAGFGGGRKLLFPGCGERQAIYKNHGLYLDGPAKTLAGNCQPGVMKNNPLAEDLFEVSAEKWADLAIHGILDSHGSITDMLFGNSRKDYEKSCAIQAENYELDSGEFDLVIASAGGFPKDINFIQSHKAIHNAAMFVKDEGKLIIYSECRDGIGSTTFLPWFALQDYDRAFEQLCHNYEGNGGTALSMMNKLQRIRIAMITSLDEETCRAIGVEKLHHHQVEKLLAETKTKPAWIANGSLTVKKN
jgi:nickel-dependent lactate racemase